MKRNIEVINITQSPVSIIPTLKKLSLEGYVYAISKLSLLVGIDSSAGHVASFYNIPSITIFNSNPFYSKDIKSNYRPLRNNISLYTKNEEKVSFKDVFKLVESCAKNDFNFKNHMIDSKNKYNCIVKDNFWSN